MSIRPFSDADRRVAEIIRLDRELQLHGAGIEREIVLLQAETEDALKETHRRYFGDIAPFEDIALAAAGARR